MSLHRNVQRIFKMGATLVVVCVLHFAGYHIALMVATHQAPASMTIESIHWAAVLSSPIISGLIILPLLSIASAKSGLPLGRQRP